MPCLFAYSKRSFYSVVNTIFGKLLNVASEEIILQLIADKCIPVLLYGLESCHLTKSDSSRFHFHSHVQS